MEDYELRRGSYKNLTLRVLPPHGVLRVSAPWFLPRFVVDQFVTDRAAWIAERRRTLVAVPVWAPGSTLPVWGKAYTLQVTHPGRVPRVTADPAASVLTLRVPAGWGPEPCRRAVERWEAEQVARALDTLVPAWSARMGLVPATWTVRRMRSRWGSCQPQTGKLAFNARLAAFPPACLEYVVVHELAHLQVPHHGPAFHALVNRWLPGADQARAVLRAGFSGSTGPDASPDPLSTDGEEREL
jgi:predicted metal-dependent hydrolase